MFVLIAISVAVTDPRGSIGYFAGLGFPVDFLIAAFAISATVMFSRPVLRWYAAAHIPILMFSIAAITYAYAQSIHGMSVTVYYCAMLIAFPIAFRLSDKSTIRIHHIYGVLMLLIGLAIMAYPARGTVAYIENEYGIPSAALGFSLVAFAAYLLINGTATAFRHVSVLLVFYVSCVVVVAWNSLSYTAMLINLNLLVTLLFTMTRAHAYFAPEVMANVPVPTPQGAKPVSDGV